MKLARNLLILAAVVTFGAFTFRPVPILPEEECLVTSGVIAKAWVTESHDVFFELTDDHRRFYLNRGTEKGLSIGDVAQLKGKQVRVIYPDYFTILDPCKSTRHVTKLTVDETVIFSEYP